MRNYFIQKRLLSLLLLYLSFPLLAQNTPQSFLIVQQISIEGNKRTLNKILLRELDFTIGDTLWLSDTSVIFEHTRNKLFNTNLFVFVKIYAYPLQDSLPNTKLKIEVKERWYLFPELIFDLADRNFNEWWYVRKRDLSRTNLGIRVRKYNMRGRNETLSAVVQGGFTNKYELFYDVPYVNKKQNIGVGIGVSYSTNNRVGFATTQDQTAFFDTQQRNGRTRFYAKMRARYRPQFYTTQFVELQYHHNTVLDTIAALNPDYFLNGQTQQRYFMLLYEWVYDKRNIRYYATKGWFLKSEVVQQGFYFPDPVAVTKIQTEYRHYFELNSYYSFAYKVQTKFSLQENQPYNLYQGLGYHNNFVRGYDVYVIDGQHTGLLRTTFRRKIIDIVHENKWLDKSFKQFSTVPLALYVKFFADAGYAHNPLQTQWNNQFTNRLLGGTGVGIDIISYYDLIFRLEYSWNDTGKNGFFFTIGSDF